MEVQSCFYEGYILLMKRLILIRFGQGVFALWAVSLIVFGLGRISADPSYTMMAMDATVEEREAFKEQLGLNDPLVVQYSRYLGNLLKGNLGKSLKYPEVGAGGAILDRLPATLYLAGVSLALAVFIGVPLGIIGAVKRDTLFDQGSKILALLGQSMPNFWLGLMMMWIFSVKLGWLPAGELGGWKHIIMPAITLGSFQIAAITRLVRSAMLETLDTEYVKLVRIKGVKESKVVWVHCLRNAAPTPLTYFGMFAAVLMTGSVTTETIFSWPGTGQLAFQSVLARDFGLIQGLVLVFAAIFVISSFLVDVLYAYLDPRIRFN